MTSLNGREGGLVLNVCIARTQSTACLFLRRSSQDVASKTREIQLLRVTRNVMADQGASEEELHRIEIIKLEKTIQVCHLINSPKTL